MKLFFLLLTKASKIVKLIGYVYTGLLAAKAALQVIQNNTESSKLEKIIQYLNVTISVTKTILTWLNAEDMIKQSENEAKNISVEDLQMICNKEIQK